MSNAGLDPTFINGGIINSFNSNAQLGKGDYLIAEADESDQSFLLLQPSVSVITNIEPDHLVNYENSFPNLKNAFLQFIKNLPFNGVSIVCGDDEVIKDLKINFQRPHISYGFEMDNDFVLSDYESSGTQSYFKMTSDSGSVDLNLNMLGKHNALNAAAAAILCLQEGISIEVIQESLIGFMGIDRRMQILGEHTVNDHSCIYFDDYGHHPTEIEKTIEAIKDSYPDRKIVMVFQPHRFSRTKDLFHEFVQVLRQVDQLLLLDIYPAGEKAVDGIDSANLKKSLIDTGFDSVELVKDNQRVMNKIDKNIHSDTVFVFQGAGDISAISQQIKSNFFPDGQ
jgi:UDP-N-acetylmuramate--alanine ligase